MNEDEVKYRLTPKGIFSVALSRLNLVDGVSDWRIDAAWDIFQLLMEKNGYIQEPEDSE